MSATVHLEGMGEDDGGPVFYLQIGNSLKIAEMTLANRFANDPHLSLTQAIRKSLEPYTVEGTCERAIQTGIIEPMISNEHTSEKYPAKLILAQFQVAVTNPDGISERPKWQSE